MILSVFCLFIRFRVRMCRVFGRGARIGDDLGCQERTERLKLVFRRLSLLCEETTVQVDL